MVFKIINKYIKMQEKQITHSRINTQSSILTNSTNNNNNNTKPVTPIPKKEVKPYIPVKRKSLECNSILQYWVYVINIRILAANQKKWGRGFANQSQNFNAGFLKPTMYNISRIFCLMFLMDALKPRVEMKLKTYSYSQSYSLARIS